MHIWTIHAWEKNLPEHIPRRTGLRFRYDRNVPPEVKRACSEFAVWLRTQYHFPLRVVVYVKGTETIRTKDGDHVVGSFFEPFSYSDEPYYFINGQSLCRDCLSDYAAQFFAPYLVKGE